MKQIERDALRESLRSSMFGGNVIVRDALSSTNTLARELGLQGAPEGTLVIAEEQTAGRGRMGRQWLSPKYANLLFSVLLRPVLPADRVFVLTMVFGLAGAEGIAALSGVDPTIKWPNDLYVGRKKIGGILTEFSAGAGNVGQVVLGLGLNVNWNPRPEGCRGYPSTSICAESGRSFSREDLLVEILTRLEAYYGAALSGETAVMKERWNMRSMLLGRWVAVDTGRQTLRGKARGIDDTGALILEEADGKAHQVLNGDVSLEEIEDECAGDR
jgi:BirA family biotin operon repressor/biotin-[acetyl-CoA-carboxylase] ligase